MYGVVVVTAYSLVPWVAVMALGFCLGPVFLKPAAARQRTLIGVGAGMTIAFLIIRAVNGYGDPAPWSPQPSPMLSAMSFLNTTKYPPSLAFLLMTLGPALLILGIFEGLAVPTQESAHRIRPGAPVLFRAALLRRARGGSAAGRRDLRPQRVDVHVPAGAVDGRTCGSVSAELRLRLVGHVSRLDCDRGRFVSALCVVRADQRTTPRVVGFIPLGV